MLKGKVHKYGADVNTDVIIPARYLNIYDPAELAKYCMEDIDEDFLKKMTPGDIIMATTNFGCGSSREHAPLAIKAAGISCVIAKSFARIFFRNAINIGLPLVEVPDHAIKSGHHLQVDLAQGVVIDTTAQRSYHAAAMPQVMMDILSEGGLVEYLIKHGDYPS